MKRRNVLERFGIHSVEGRKGAEGKAGSRPDGGVDRTHQAASRLGSQSRRRRPHGSPAVSAGPRHRASGGGRSEEGGHGTGRFGGSAKCLLGHPWTPCGVRADARTPQVGGGWG